MGLLISAGLFLRMKSAETSSPQLQTFFTAVCQDRWTAHVQSSRAEGFFEKRRMRAVTDNAAKIQDIIRSLSPELIDLSLIVKIKISNLTYQIKLSDLKELLESFVGDQSTPPNPLVTNMLIEQVKNIVSNLQKPRDFKAK